MQYRTFYSNSLRQTNLISRRIIKLYSDINLFIINGELGSGKTTIVKGIAKELGIKELITSPTFGIKNTYKSLIHYDFYLVETIGGKEFLNLLDEEIEQNYVVVEWGKRIVGEKLPTHVLIDIKIISDKKRKIKTKLIY